MRIGSLTRPVGAIGLAVLTLALVSCGGAWGRAQQHRQAAGVGVTQVNGRPDRLVVVDASLGGTPLQGASTDGWVWILTCRCGGSNQNPPSAGQLLWVSRRSGKVTRRIAVSDPQALAVGAGAIWIAHWSGEVTRVDPATGKTSRTVSLVLPKSAQPYFRHDHPRAFLPYSISISNGSVWVSSARGWLAELDAASGRLKAMLRAPFDVTGQVISKDGKTWVAESVLGLGLIAPGADRLKLKPITYLHRQLTIDYLAIGGGRIWGGGVVTRPSAALPGGRVLTSRAVLTIFDERSGKIERQLPVPAGPDQIAYADGALYLVDHKNGRVLRVDLDYKIHRLRSIHAPGTLLTITADAIWTATASGKLHRILLR